MVQGPAAPDKKDAVTDDFILKASEILRPTHRFATPQEMLDHFKESRARTIAYVTDALAYPAPHRAIERGESKSQLPQGVSGAGSKPAGGLEGRPSIVAIHT